MSLFRCYVGQLKFFNWSVEPVITVSVTVQERGCTIRLLSCRLQGSSFVDDINNKFSASMTNVVQWRELLAEPGSSSTGGGGSSSSTDADAAATDNGAKEIVSNTSIEVNVEVPGWFQLIPVSGIESTGSGVMQKTVDIMVPRFLKQLEKDYELWASGDASRKPVGEGIL